MQEDRCFDVGKPILGAWMEGTMGVQSIIIKPNTELFRGIKHWITKEKASNLPCKSTPVHHSWMCGEGCWPSRPGKGCCCSHGNSWDLRLFIQNAEFTSHLPMKGVGPAWGFLAEKTNKQTKRKEKEEWVQPSGFFTTFCLGHKPWLLEASVYLWSEVALLYAFWDSSKGQIIPGAPFCPLHLPDGSLLNAAVTGTLHTDPQHTCREIHVLASPPFE